MILSLLYGIYLLKFGWAHMNDFKDLSKMRRRQRKDIVYHSDREQVSSMSSYGKKKQGMSHYLNFSGFFVVNIYVSVLQYPTHPVYIIY